jgi:hypothetical protein
MRHYGDILARLDKLDAGGNIVPRFDVTLATGEMVTMYGGEIIAPAAGGEIRAIKYYPGGPCYPLDLVNLAQALSSGPIQVTEAAQ